MFVGVVGKPNVGKSTFFKAATLAEVEIANYPFATIKPNTGVAYVKVKDPAKQFGKTSNPRNGFVLHDWRFVPIQLIDVAGLVPGAYEGKGMGNQFLDDLRQADVLIHVIDISGSTNEKGEVIEALSYDPAEDVQFLEKELDMWYLGILKKGWDRFARQVVQEKGKIAVALGKQLSGLKVTEDIVERALRMLGLNMEKPHEWSESELLGLATELRRKTKPMVIACNKIDIPGAAKNFERLKSMFPDHMFVACSAESELALREAAKHGWIDYVPGENTFTIVNAAKLTDKQQHALQYIKKEILDVFGMTGVQTILDTAVFSLLKYIAIFPGGVAKLEDQHGNVIPDCFLMPPNTTAIDFAYRLHTDFGKNFIKAINVKTKLPIGRDEALKHGDIIEIAARS